MNVAGKRNGLEVLMCKARIAWCAYLPMGSSSTSEPKVLQDYGALRDLVPRNGLHFELHKDQA